MVQKYVLAAACFLSTGFAYSMQEATKTAIPTVKDTFKQIVRVALERGETAYFLGLLREFRDRDVLAAAEKNQSLNVRSAKLNYDETKVYIALDNGLWKVFDLETFKIVDTKECNLFQNN